jgi:HSP20 family protein
MATNLTPKVRNGDVATPENTYGVTFRPRFDIWEKDEELLLCGDLPGVAPENLDIRFENRELVIHGKVSPRPQGAELLYEEYSIGDFYRTFRIGEAVSAEQIRAELKNGVLTVHLPKAEAAKPRRISVSAE